MNNFAHQFITQISKYNNQRALVFHNETVSYETMKLSILGAANFFKKQVAPGDRVMLRADDSPEWIYSLLGLIYVGAVPVIISTQFISNRAIDIADSADCKMIIVNEKDSLNDSRVLHIEQVDFSNSNELTCYSYGQHEAGFMIASSGTTGKNKLVVHLHNTWLETLKILLGHYAPFTNDEVMFATSKMSFQYVWSMVFATLWTGQTLVLHHTLMIGTKLLKFINQHQVTRLLTSPPILLSLAEVDPTVAPGQLDCVRMIISGGEPVRDTVEADIQKLYNKPIYQVYGSSEVITIPTAQNYDNARPGSIGKIVSGVSLRVINEDGDDADTNEVGELYVKMPTVALEYLNEPELSADTFRAGWFKTNDLVKFDQDGFYYFIGRKNDVKKVNGIFVSPIEIELALLNMPNIKDCMVGIELDDTGRPNIVANIVLENIAQTIGSLDVRKFLTSRLETYKIPKVIKFIDVIPRTVTGKKMRSLIQQ